MSAHFLAFLALMSIVVPKGKILFARKPNEIYFLERNFNFALSNNFSKEIMSWICKIINKPFDFLKSFGMNAATNFV